MTKRGHGGGRKLPPDEVIHAPNPAADCDYLAEEGRAAAERRRLELEARRAATEGDGG